MPVVQLQKRIFNEVPVEKEIFQNIVTLKHITNLVWYNNDDQVTNFTIKAMLSDADSRFGWCYLSCNFCKKKIPENLYCQKCRKELKFPQMRYNIEMKVTDESAKTTFLLFDSIAQKLIGLSCYQLLNKQENDIFSGE
ncbi:replication protein A 70 kDa DNA-binding subunit D-like [Pistacia vera]|uniref:replication protein A 70 kDa DNA-binding subunit D-like n=1 Tax=Pistacia vera TaxID=55513 RepID=UPI001262F385|nr:replication protein A 70 kDa DNA-binding subunit D-like [Pistacia vera]